MKLGIESLLDNKKLLSELKAKRLGLLAHPASVNHKLTHSLDLLNQYFEGGKELCAAIGPQHGIKGDKQDNMIETEDAWDDKMGIPHFSLYSKTRRLSPKMLETFDVLLFDLQDLGCRIYTYATTLLYVMQDLEKHNKSLWVLDRPNPIGRPIEGPLLKEGWESFVGLGPIPIRHGLTLGELAMWIKKHYAPKLDLTIVPMQDYQVDQAPNFGWPSGELSWVNPSPNVPTLCTARCFPGTVLLEGTSLSEGRGTTRPLQIFGAPGLDSDLLLDWVHENYRDYLKGCLLREAHFEPTFHKHAGKSCSGLQIHVDQIDTYRHDEFRPFRLMLSLLKGIRTLQPKVLEWREIPYEYEHDRLAIDLICGTDAVRKWVDDPSAGSKELEALLSADEAEWSKTRRDCLLY